MFPLDRSERTHYFLKERMFKEKQVSANLHQSRVRMLAVQLVNHFAIKDKVLEAISRRRKLLVSLYYITQRRFYQISNQLNNSRSARTKINC